MSLYDKRYKSYEPDFHYKEEDLKKSLQELKEIFIDKDGVIKNIINKHFGKELTSSEPSKNNIPSSVTNPKNELSNSVSSDVGELRDKEIADLFADGKMKVKHTWIRVYDSKTGKEGWISVESVLTDLAKELDSMKAKENKK